MTPPEPTAAGRRAHADLMRALRPPPVAVLLLALAVLLLVVLVVLAGWAVWHAG